ncbi:peptidylprolyl isomerase [Thalassotalea mangrovi]|uniref:Peptidyl-prolyl cis-trans isomerase n=1 Tax=Thalassotalea mangrovi TaxID=2572245 RepID=A0A4U1B556_9GAMM|nr:peptidylprolyl isomerase [Thalassotalea mangrovi]TKB45543.1 peptidyl-prolyl cis-trans isomerase [Thalassotalea mangrovi]
MQRIRRYLKDPLWLFMLTGALIFYIDSLMQSPVHNEVAFSSKAMQRHFEQPVQLLSQHITAAEQAKMTQQYRDREILFYEALELGLHLNDPMVRKALVERMRQIMVSDISYPDEGELIDYYSSNLHRYQSDFEISFEQFHLPMTTPDVAQALSLLAQHPDLQEIDSVRRRTFNRYGLSVLRAMYDDEQLAQLQAATKGAWIALAPGENGLHLVRVLASYAPEQIPYLRIKDQVRTDVLAIREQEAIDNAMSRLRSKYHSRSDRQITAD